jgi:hypothetical protein
MKTNQWDSGPARYFNKYASDDFNVFIQNIFSDSENARGAMYRVFNRYMAASDYVGKFENLRGDLTIALNKAGCNIEESDLLDKKINVSSGLDEWKDRCVYSKRSKETVLHMESRFIKRYKYGR